MHGSRTIRLLSKWKMEFEAFRARTVGHLGEGVLGLGSFMMTMPAYSRVASALLATRTGSEDFDRGAKPETMVPRPQPYALHRVRDEIRPTVLDLRPLVARAHRNDDRPRCDPRTDPRGRVLEDDTARRGAGLPVLRRLSSAVMVTAGRPRRRASCTRALGRTTHCQP